MSESVKMPALGESVTEGTVSSWLKAVGDTVEADEPLLEVATDKVDTEVPSPASGVLLEIRVPEDETVEVGTVLAIIGSPSAAPATASAPAATPEAPDPAAVPASAALVPLGTPLLAGPGAIVAAMVAVDTTGGGVAGWVSVTAAIIGTHIAIWASLRFSLGLNRVLGTSGIRILTRVMGLLLAAIAVQIMADGVFAFLETRL